MSGANSTPLGRINPAIGAGKKSGGTSLLNPSYMSAASNGSAKRDGSCSPNEREERRKKRKSRWQGDDKDKAFIPGMPTVLPSNMSKEQEEAYLLQLQIEEFSRRLRMNDLGIPPNPEDRSPSPEPIYNIEGKRLNTREYRTRKRLEDNRHDAIIRMMQINPEYKPPADYKPPIVKVSDKVMIPQEEHPDINFVGLLIGPRGNTLKAMEKETGAKIIIRGKGSVKEGKVGRKDGGPLPGEDEPLHAYVTASNPESVKKAVDKIREIIRQGVEVPEGQNDLRRMQLRELALLNGTLRENDVPRCSNCGATTHKSWMCPDKPNVTNNVLCTICGAAGHIAKDCLQPRPGQLPGSNANRQKIDEEYMSLMAELGEGPPPQSVGSADQRNTSAPRPLFEHRIQPPRPLMGPERNDSFGGQFNSGSNSTSSWGSATQFTPRPLMQSSSTHPNITHPPPSAVGNYQQGPPTNYSGGPNLLQAPPPPPPTTISASKSPSNNWLGQNSGPPSSVWPAPPPGPPGVACPPPGPVPPPRPLPPPPVWGWNGPQSPVGPPPPPPPPPPGAPPAPRPSGVDLGALLSAPPPPPPS